MPPAKTICGGGVADVVAKQSCYAYYPPIQRAAVARRHGGSVLPDELGEGVGRSIYAMLIDVAVKACSRFLAR